MTKTALTYAWTIIAIGSVILAGAALGWQSSNGQALLVCVGLAALAATFKVKLPKLTGTISPAFVFLQVAVATLSWSETVMIAAVSGVVQCVWRPKARPTALQVAFNAAVMAISGGVAHAVTRGLATIKAADALPVMLGASGVALLVCNTLLVSTILCLIQEGHFYRVWRSVQLWAVPYYLGGGLLASVWARVEMAGSAWCVILAAASVYLLSVCGQELGRLICPTDKQSSCALP